MGAIFATTVLRLEHPNVPTNHLANHVVLLLRQVYAGLECLQRLAYQSAYHSLKSSMRYESIDIGAQETKL